MTIDELRATLDDLGVTLSVRGTRLVADAAAAVLTPEIVGALREYKLELMAGLTMPESSDVDAVGYWSVPWRERWGHRVNGLLDDGVAQSDAEQRAFDEVAAEVSAAMARGERVHARVEPGVPFDVRGLDDGFVPPRDEPRPQGIGVPTYGLTATGRVIELITLTRSAWKNSRVAKVSGDGWPGWYAVEPSDADRVAPLRDAAMAEKRLGRSSNLRQMS